MTSGPMLSMLTFLAVVLAVGGVYSVCADLFLRNRARANNRIDDEFRRGQRAKAERSSLFKDLSQLSADIEVGKPSAARRFASMVEQSGLETSPQKVLTTSACAALGLAALGFVARGSLIPAAVGLVLGGAAPILYVRQKRNGRREALRKQLPDAFELMARVIRAGQTMAQALLAVADEFAPPISAEFSYCYEQQNLGLSPELAYRDLARRNDLIELKLFVLALLVQQQTGGNLAELIDKLSGVLRERSRIKGVVQTLTAEGRMQAIILMALPPVIFVLMLVLNPAYAMQLFVYPKLIAVTLTFEGLGALWIRKIVNFEY